MRQALNGVGAPWFHFGSRPLGDRVAIVEGLATLRSGMRDLSRQSSCGTDDLRVSSESSSGKTNCVPMCRSCGGVLRKGLSGICKILRTTLILDGAYSTRFKEMDDEKAIDVCTRIGCPDRESRVSGFKGWACNRPKVPTHVDQLRWQRLLIAEC